MDLNPLIWPWSLSHQQQHSMRAAIKRKHLALLNSCRTRFIWCDDFV